MAILDSTFLAHGTIDSVVLKLTDRQLPAGKFRVTSAHTIKPSDATTAKMRV